MNRETLDNAIKQLDKVDDYLFGIAKKHGEFIYEDQHFIIFTKEEEDIGFDGDPEWSGSAFCFDEVLVNEEYEEQIEIVIPAYRYCRDRVGNFYSVNFDSSMYWLDEGIGFTYKGKTRKVA